MSRLASTNSCAPGRPRTPRPRRRPAEGRAQARDRQSMLTPAQAETLIEQHLACLPIESLRLTQAGGAILRENIYAERDQPPFDRVAMDGIALSAGAAAENSGRLRVAGSQAAGDPPATLPDGSSCIEIMTGA